MKDIILFLGLASFLTTLWAVDSVYVEDTSTQSSSTSIEPRFPQLQTEEDFIEQEVLGESHHHQNHHHHTHSHHHHHHQHHPNPHSKHHQSRNSHHHSLNHHSPEYKASKKNEADQEELQVQQFQNDDTLTRGDDRDASLGRQFGNPPFSPSQNIETKSGESLLPMRDESPNVEGDLLPSQRTDLDPKLQSFQYGRQYYNNLGGQKDQEGAEGNLQEDSPYFGGGGYGSLNKFSHNHGNCRLSESWKGKWFLSGAPTPILIDGKSMEGKGTCYESSGDKFLFVDKTGCHRCMVINQKHTNVLEFKESSFCEEKSTLDTLCSGIPGDAPLYSLFKADAQPITCPFKGPYTFSYNKGSGLCKSPVSHVDTCTEPSRLLLRYQACPDVPKSESTVEELICLGQWRDSTFHYLVGKLNYRLAVTNEDRYRCFIYETIKGHTVVKIAVSGDATCSGLSSPYDGAKTLTFTKASEGGSKCKFPNWVSSHHWHSLDGKLSVKTNHKNSTMHIQDNSPREPGSFSSASVVGGSSHNHQHSQQHHHHHPHSSSSGGGSSGGLYSLGNFGNYVPSVAIGSGDVQSLFLGGTRITCQESLELSEEHVAIRAQHTEGCTSTTVCIHFYKRDSHVIELQMRKHGSGYYDDYDCGSPEALGPNLPYVTLINAEVESRRCPYLGKYMTTGVSQDGRLIAGGDLCPNNQQIQHQHGNFHSVVVGCGQRATMDFHSKCITQEPITSYVCHGHWEENGTGFLIASPLSRSSTSASRFCFTYLDTEGGLQFFSSSLSCRRDVSPNVEGIWAFNLTVDGQCAEPMTGAAARSSTHCDLHCWSACLATLVLVTFYTFLSTTTTTTSPSITKNSITNYYTDSPVSMRDSPFAKILASFFPLLLSSKRISSHPSTFFSWLSQSSSCSHSSQSSRRLGM